MKKSWLIYAFILVLGLFVGTRITYFTQQKEIRKAASIDDIRNLVISHYVDTVDINRLNEMAIEALINGLDPHSAYLPPVQSKSADEDLQGNFDGIGVQFRMLEDTVNIIQPVSGGPSEKVGIMAGDQIIRVEGENIAGAKMSTEEVIKRLKGKRGTTVNVEVQRPGLSKLLSFAIVRDKIPTYSVDVAFMVDTQIGYIKLSKFSATTAKEVEESLQKLLNQGMKKLIFDLRGNTGGYMSEAIQVADHFLPSKKMIVYTEGLNRPKSEAFASSYGLFEKQDVVVLLDEWSASASEIIAGALQDNDRGHIVGRRSFGKGLVQEQLNLSNGASIRLTVARYHTPTGRCIQQPYTVGQSLDEELFNRYTSGEFLSQDSVKFDTLQKYTTPKGRIVYGGGGIMPDIYVPYQTDSTLIFYNQLINKGLILRYSYNYTRLSRKELLKKYATIDDFKANFTVSDDLFNEMIRFAQQNGLKPHKGSVEKNKQRIRDILKAYIARDLFDDEGFYPIYLPTDNDFIRALEVLQKKA